MDKEITAYIAQCEIDVAASKEKIAAQERKQHDFNAALTKCLEDVVAIMNKPLQDLIHAIRKS